MPRPRPITLPIAAVWVCVVAAGGLAGWFGFRSREEEVRAELLRDMDRLAAAFDGAADATAAGDDSRRAALEERLQRLRLAFPEVRYFGLYRSLADGGLVELAHATIDGWRLPAPLLDPARSPALLDAVRFGEATATAPRTDGGGRWVTAYAPLPSAPGPRPGVRDILVLDGDAAHWRRQAAQSALQAAFSTWVVLGLPFLAFLAARRQLRQREVIRNLSEAIEQSHSEIMIVGLDARLDYANRGLCGQLGYTRRELLGHDWRELGLAPAGDSYGEMERVVCSGHAWDGEWSNRRKDGSTYPVHGFVTPVKDADDRVGCWVVVLEDTTEAKRREAELRDARDRAEAGDRAKGHFLATMSHEVRTPLNGIVGFTSLLLETPLSGEQRDYVQTIRLSTEALIQLTGDILDFARVESGKLKLELLPCDPRECIEDALDLLAAKAAEKQIELLHHTAPDLPAAVLTDGGRLRQVLVNLIGNAIKFTEKGEVTVGVRPLPADHPEAAAAIAARGPRQGVFEFYVRDTGIGIDPTQHVKLFRPFTQVDDSSTRRYSGTGLGLAISRNLVRLMGGEISMTSAPGRGSEFRFTISAAIAAPQPPHRDLDGLPVGWVARPGALRGEIACLLTGWNAKVVEAETASGLPAGCRAVVVDVDELMAAEFVADPCVVPGVRPARTIAIVPVTLSSELRGVLRTQFGTLLNKPVRHEALFSLLAGCRSGSPFPPVPPTHFGFRVLLIEDNPMEQRLVQRVLANLGCSWQTVETGRAAAAELLQRSGEYDLVLLGMHDREADARAALSAIRGGGGGPRAQTIWVIALSTESGDAPRRNVRLRGANDYVPAPVEIGEVEAAFKRFRSERTNRRR